MPIATNWCHQCLGGFGLPGDPLIRVLLYLLFLRIYVEKLDTLPLPTTLSLSPKLLFPVSN